MHQLLAYQLFTMTIMLHCQVMLALHLAVVQLKLLQNSWKYFHRNMSKVDDKNKIPKKHRVCD